MHVVLIFQCFSFLQDENQKQPEMKLLYTLLAITFSYAAVAQIPGYTLIADYPLTSDAVDATGNYGNTTLTNAPFQDGGVYSNGVYNDGTTNGSIIQVLSRPEKS